MVTTTIALTETQLAKLIVKAIAENNIKLAFTRLEQLMVENTRLPQEWLQNTAKALETSNWDLLSHGFINQQFIGKDGYFLLIAPYTVRRQITQTTKLTVIYGRVISVPTIPVEQLEHILKERIGELHQSIPKVVPFESLATCGNVGSEQGEAFIVANNWDFADSFLGPSLNDMTEQKRRFLDSGKECIFRIWEPDSADFLLAALENDNVSLRNRHWEYQFHDLGHASGLGINRKIKENLFSNYWYASVEEWRSDGVEFDVAQALLSSEEAGQIVAVNLCVRLALDAHRRGGMNKDGDVCASLLTFDRLLESGELDIKNNCLCLQNLNYQSLLRGVELHRQEAVNLTQEELKLDDGTGIFRLYGSVKYNKISEKLFQWIVINRCQELYPILR